MQSIDITDYKNRKVFRKEKLNRNSFPGPEKLKVSIILGNIFKYVPVDFCALEQILDIPFLFHRSTR
jgi:hypothetical protein